MSETELVQMCCNMRPFLKILNLVISILQWTIPLLLIVLGTIDMVKVVASGDEKVAKDAQITFMKRLLYGALIFLVPFLVRVVLKIVEDNIIKDNGDFTSATAWISCWNNMKNDNYCNDESDDIYHSDKTCYVYKVNGINIVSSNKPSASDDATVQFYTCNASISCSSYSEVTSKCTYNGGGAIDKIGNLGDNNPDPVTYACYQFDYCAVGYYCESVCYGYKKSAKTFSDCKLEVGTTCFNNNASICVTDGGLGDMSDFSLMYSNSSNIPNIEKYSSGKLVTCTVPCDQASASTCS